MTKQRETREKRPRADRGARGRDAIPSERQLGVDLGVSRLTVRAALDELVREGYLVRRQGAGTFVAEPKVAKGMKITSFSDDMRERGLRPAAARSSFETIPAGARLGRILHVSPAEPVIRPSACGSRTASRWRSSCCTSGQSLVPGLTAARSRRELVLRPAREPLRHRHRRRHADGRADRDERGGVGVLGVPLHSPALLFERMTRTRERGHRGVHAARPTAATGTGSSPSSALGGRPRRCGRTRRVARSPADLGTWCPRTKSARIGIDNLVADL